MAKIKNILIFVAIGVVLIVLYISFIKSPGEEDNLAPSLSTDQSASSGAAASLDPEFLGLLLNVKNIKLNVAIFSDPAFTSLQSTTIDLTPDGTEGRPNPFAPIGSDNFQSSTLPISTETSFDIGAPEY